MQIKNDFMDFKICILKSPEHLKIQLKKLQLQMKSKSITNTDKLSRFDKVYFPFLSKQKAKLVV